MVKHLVIATLLAVAVLAALSMRAADPVDLWLTPDQQGHRAVQERDWTRAVERFEDPMWGGVAAYAGGKYVAAADNFGRIPTAAGFYNRGNALMKSGDYGKAIGAYEQAVLEAPDWAEAQENLELARYVQDYIFDLREASDTGDETELSADDYKFDNTEDRGKEMTITKESTMDLAAAEMWMRSVDTDTRDFLQSRFLLEKSRAAAQ